MCFDDSKDHYDCQSGRCWTSKTIEDSINCKERKRVSNGMTPAFCSCFGHNYTNFGRNYPCLLQRTPHEHHVQYWMHLFVVRDTFCIHKHLSCIHIRLHNILHISRICDCKCISNLLTYCPISWSAWRMIFHEQATKKHQTTTSLGCPYTASWPESVSTCKSLTPLATGLHCMVQWWHAGRATDEMMRPNNLLTWTIFYAFREGAERAIRKLWRQRDSLQVKQICFWWMLVVKPSVEIGAATLSVACYNPKCFIFLYIQPHLENN